VGQITRSFVASSEVTLITDRSMAVPVESQRTGARSVVFGASQGALELRYLSNSVELKAGERWVTSGLDRIYPAGLPVGKVSEVATAKDAGFARNRLQAIAEVDQSRMLLVLLVDASVLPAPPPVVAPEKGKKGSAR
jgi:rod shape-determining protein MreC